ncbi:MAG: hypothetical protein HOO85_04125 [Methylotenera sp.]|jgi:hypothetical protein|nr:hypothetical protein [Methylotenera sp.]
MEYGIAFYSVGLLIAIALLPFREIISKDTPLILYLMMVAQLWIVMLFAGLYVLFVWYKKEWINYLDKRSHII